MQNTGTVTGWLYLCFLRPAAYADIRYWNFNIYPCCKKKGLVAIRFYPNATAPFSSFYSRPSNQPLRLAPQKVWPDLEQTLKLAPQRVWQTLKKFDYPGLFHVRAACKSRFRTLWLRLRKIRLTNRTSRALRADCYGGDGGSRTRVRKYFHRNFSERSWWFKLCLFKHPSAGS